MCSMHLSKLPPCFCTMPQRLSYRGRWIVPAYLISWMSASSHFLSWCHCCLSYIREFYANCSATFESWYIMYMYDAHTSLQVTLASLSFILFKHYIGISCVNIPPYLANSWVVTIAIENRIAIAVFLHKCTPAFLE